MKLLILTITLWLFHVLSMAQAPKAESPIPVPQVTIGSIERLENFPSRFVQARHVDVWLPEGYDARKRYQVLYMQDGQMLFDATHSWNGRAWDVHQTMAKLRKGGRIADTLVVGIWNAEKYRHSEYFPQKFLQTVSPAFRAQYEAKYLQNKPQADNYLRFIVQELKPEIDRRYSTLTDRSHTFILGSSMGGAISVYAMNEYPNVFGGAAGLSLAWVGQGSPNFELPLAGFNYLQHHLASSQGHKLYMDYGDRDMDSWFANYQRFVDEIVRDKGYTEANWQSRFFPGTGHTELDWAARLDIPLVFLLSGNPDATKTSPSN